MKYEKPTFIKINGTNVRIKGSLSHIYNMQPAVLHNIKCQECKNRLSEKCNTCIIPTKSNIPSNYEKVKILTNNKIEKDSINLEEIKIDLMPYKISDKFSFFKLIKNNKIIFMGFGHKNHIENLKGVLNNDKEKLSIAKEEIKILITNKMNYINFDNCGMKEKDEIIDDIFNLIVSTMEKGEDENICQLCGSPKIDKNSLYCISCEKWYETEFGNGSGATSSIPIKRSEGRL